MRVFVFVNRAHEVHHRQTTALLIAASVRRQIPTHVASVDGLTVSGVSRDECQLIVRGRQLPSDCGISELVEKACAKQTLEQQFILGQDDVILIRTNPGRDPLRTMLHTHFLELANVAELQGVRVCNSPSRLAFFGSKASLAILEPTYRTPMLVSSDAKVICDFIRDAPGDCVIKPTVGSRGCNVLRVGSSSDSLYETVQGNMGDSGLVVQQFIQAEYSGDQRVVVLDGEILRRDEQIAGIRRVPAGGDFRANLHAGGTAQPVQIDDSATTAVRQAAQLLYRHGIRLAGIDLIGDQIIEFNVFSTGGIYDANRFAGHDFSDDIVARLLS